MIAYEDGVDYETLRFTNCTFKGYFYSTDLRAIEYSAAPDDPLNRVIKGVWITGCKSYAPVGKNAGHFQHTGISNTRCILCETYSGQNATSYNFINGNGELIVSQCWDEGNSYGSLEIENNLITKGVIADNIFGSDLWIDDSSNVKVSDNICETLRVTAQSNDVSDILITDNQALRIRVEQFGVDPVGLAYNVRIKGNQTIGQVTGQECFLGAMVTGEVAKNNFDGNGDTSIAIVRRSNSNILIRNNTGSAPMLESSSRRQDR